MTALQPGDKALLAGEVHEVNGLRAFLKQGNESLGWYDMRPFTPVPSLEDVARTMYDHRESIADAIDGWTAWEDLPESWRDEWRDAAREVMRLFGVGEE